VPIDARSEKPDLSTRAAEHADQALRLFDHLAGTTTGEEQFEAAWRCGRSLALLGRYDDALDAFAFAHHTLRGMHPSDTPPHLKPLADGLSEDRKRVAYLRDVTRYGLEYLLYRRAQEHRLAGRYEQAAQGYRQVIDTAQDTMTRLLVEKLSTAPGFTAPDDDNAAKVDESPYTAASRLYEALCLIELGKAREAVQRLEAFADEDPATILPTTPALSTAKGGITPEVNPEATPEVAPAINPEAAAPTPPLLFRGQALLELGRIALEHELDLDRAETYFARLDHWIVKARADNEAWAFNDLLPGIKKAAKAKTDGPDQEYRKPDFWGNVKKAPIDPGMLVNRKTTPWYLDDLEEDTAKFLGFIQFARGENEKALASFARLLDFDEETRRLERSGQPNNFRRLKLGIEQGYLFAHPEELRLYGERHRLLVLMADALYISEDFDGAAELYTRLIDGRYGELRSDQKDFPLYARAWCIYRGRIFDQQDVIDKVIDEMEKVLARSDGTLTEYRAAYMITRFSKYHPDENRQKRRLDLLVMMAESKADNEWKWKGHINLGLALCRSDKPGDHVKGLHVLKNFPESSRYHELAQFYYREHLAK